MRSHGVGHVEAEADAHHLEVLDVCRRRVKIRLKWTEPVRFTVNESTARIHEVDAELGGEFFDAIATAIRQRISGTIRSAMADGIDSVDSADAIHDAMDGIADAFRDLGHNTAATESDVAEAKRAADRLREADAIRAARHAELAKMDALARLPGPWSHAPADKQTKGSMAVEVVGSGNLRLYKTHTPSESIVIERADIADAAALLMSIGAPGSRSRRG